MFQLQTATTTTTYPTEQQARAAQLHHPEREGSSVVPLVLEDEPGLTPTSLKLFLDYAWDSGNWSGTPLIGGNVGGSKEDRGNLTQLKRAGLITTFKWEGDMWIDFTDAGKALSTSREAPALHPEEGNPCS